MCGKLVVGIDGGGTYTRVMTANIEGKVLSYVESGGANPSHNANAFGLRNDIPNYRGRI